MSFDLQPKSFRCHSDSAPINNRRKVGFAMDDDQPQDRDDKLDETIEETFPASDAPANTVETGIGLAAPHVVDDRLTDNRLARRFELVTGGGMAVLNYERRADALVLVHTEVPPAFRGRGIKAFLRKHPQSSEIG